MQGSLSAETTVINVELPSGVYFIKVRNSVEKFVNLVAKNISGKQILYNATSHILHN